MEKSLQSFKLYLQEKDLAEKTVNDYITDVKLFLTWIQEKNAGFKESYFTILMATGYKKYMLQEKNYRADTINRKLISIKEYGKYLVKFDRLKHNPAEELDHIQKQLLSPKSLNNTELIRLFNLVYAIDNKRDIAIISALYNAGLRVSELQSLKLKHISISERKGSVFVEKSKRYKSREVSLNKDVRNAILDYLEVRPKTPGINLRQEEEEQLFKSERGFLTSSGIYRRVKKYGKLVDIEMSPHTLRHTFIRNLLDDGTDIITIGKIAGITTQTLEIYGQPRQEHIENAVEGIQLTNLITHNK